MQKKKKKNLPYPNLIYQAIFKNLILSLKGHENEMTILKRQIVNY